MTLYLECLCNVVCRRLEKSTPNQEAIFVTELHGNYLLYFILKLDKGFYLIIQINCGLG